MSLKCKQCGYENPQKRIIYQRRDWEGAGKYAGSYEYEEEFPVDSGVFCSDKCLIEYLHSERNLSSK